MRIPASSLVFAIFLVICFYSHAQELYTARGYWVETTKEAYRKIKQKQNVGDSLTTNEAVYLKDYENYLVTYYQRMSEAEKTTYDQMKAQWDRELVGPNAKSPDQASSRPEEFEWRSRDRFVNSLFGIWYGTSIVLITEMDNAAAAGIPLITGGLWLMGPVINPKKYEGITQSVVRASSSGKFLGLLYGVSLGLAVAGNSEDADKLMLGLSTVGSIALGEVGFQLQKKRNYSDGHIEMMRHYGVLGPWIGLSIVGSTNTEDAHALGAGLLAGGAGGLIIGNQVSKRYGYTKGDVDAIQSLTWISTGLGFTLMAETFDQTETSTLFLIPGAASILGTVLGQKAVKGANLTKKQGSTISLTTAGAALIGLGVVTITESENASVWVGIPSVLALVTHQLLFHKYKRSNMLDGFQGRIRRKHGFQFSMNVMPENYLINQKLPAREFNSRSNAPVANPLVKLKLTF
ncbi:MAG TPA: hypothetical protein VFU05_02940 [Cyclobacteriaceae bacterium]|nr:hypothetical protein [Cyclobacteriaceae bacterium]